MMLFRFLFLFPVVCPQMVIAVNRLQAEEILNREGRYGEIGSCVVCRFGTFLKKYPQIKHTSLKRTLSSVPLMSEFYILAFVNFVNLTKSFFTNTFVLLCIVQLSHKHTNTHARTHRPGSFLVRPSEKTPGDYALAFRTTSEVRHWKMVQDGGKFYVHPRPNPYNNLEEIIQVWKIAVFFLENI